MGKQISNRSDIATERENTADNRMPILTLNPEDGTTLVIRGMVAEGSERGFPLYADLNDENGDDLSEDTELVLEYERPGADQPQVVTEPLDHIRPYNALDLNDQQSVDYIDRTKVRLKNTDQALAKGEVPKLRVRDIDDLHISIDSPDVIDWDESRLYIDRNAVQVV